MSFCSNNYHGNGLFLSTMRFSSNFKGPGALCIFLICLISLNCCAANRTLISRGSGKKGDLTMQDLNPDDGGQSASSRRWTGIGMEYETNIVMIESEKAQAPNVPDEKTSQAKRKLVNGIRGDHYEFTADLIGRKGVLDLEIILKGQTIELGSKVLSKTLRKAIQRLVRSWAPPFCLFVAYSLCLGGLGSVSQIMDPRKRGGVREAQWSPQLTAPVPLEGIQSLIENSSPKSEELQMYRPGQHTMKVNHGRTTQQSSSQ